MTLCTNNEIFYEFIELSDYLANKNSSKRMRLIDVQSGIDYVVAIINSSGLWAYVIGDTLKFSNTNPYQFKITGRVSQFTSMFGEHIIASEVVNAIESAVQTFGIQIRAYTVAPKISSNSSQDSCHEWWIDFATKPDNLESLASHLDQQMQAQNSYYKDLIQGKGSTSFSSRLP